MQIVREKISVSELSVMSQKMFEHLVKAVVDIEQEIMVVDADLQADQEYLLLENGSKQEHLWGINIYPDQFGKDGFIVFDSMINIRPSQSNRSRGIENPQIREKIKNIVSTLVKS